jgi:dipeptidyl-peptidase-4
VEDFPRQAGRTRSFSLGVPRDFTVAPDGSRVVFLRSRSGDDPVTCLWVLDVESGEERLVFDPQAVTNEEETAPSEAERARRERVRERAGGVVAYATDRPVRHAVFSLAGRLMHVDLTSGLARELPVPGPVEDPRLDPTGDRIAFVVNGALHVAEIDGQDRALPVDQNPGVSWGLAEFIAAEEMHRFRAHWWSPDGTRIAATRVDERPVATWYIGDPADPASPPRQVRYPAAGSANAIVALALFDVARGERVDVQWDSGRFPYLARVDWSQSAPLTLLVQSRDQRTTRVLEVDDRTGETSVVATDTDPTWVDLPDDSLSRLDDGKLVRTVLDRDTRRVSIGGRLVTPPGLHVRAILSTGDDGVVFQASEEPTEIHVWRVNAKGTPPERLTDASGVHTASAAGGLVVIASSGHDDLVPRTDVVRDGKRVATIRCLAEPPVVRPEPLHLSLGARDIRAALLLPQSRRPEEQDRLLPVLLDPYGGPGAQRVLRTAAAHLTSQWFADQGFAVLVADGRGTPGRGAAWERSMFEDFTVALEDQVEALRAAAERFAFLDLSHVGIRGWSFGGYLAAMAVLRRPEVFHAAVAGAPVTDWRLYDTHYTERYLGRPDEAPDVYRRNSLLADAPGLERPLLMLHGLADDNVLAAHTLRFSAALFESGRRHEVVLLPDTTHLSRAESTTENLLLLQLDFLRRALRLDPN